MSRLAEAVRAFFRHADLVARRGMSRLAEAVRAFFRHADLVGVTALLACPVGGIGILVSFGALGLFAAAAVYSACGIVAYFHHRELRRGFEQGVDTVISMIIKWPIFMIRDAYDVMQWGCAPPRFQVYVVPRLDEGLFDPGRTKDLGWFRKWDEAVNCARRNEKELSGAVWISDRVRPWMYLVDGEGGIERRKIVGI